MKKLTKTFFLIVIFFACGIFAAAQNEKPQTNSKYDKSKDLTTVRLKAFTITKLGQEKQVGNNIPLHQMDLEISYNYQGKEMAKPVEEVTLRFHPVANNYIFLKAQQIIAVLDRDTPGKDRALPLGVSDYKSVAPKFNSIYEEFLSIKIPSDAFKKMANANSLQIYVGPVGYELTTEQLNLIRRVASLLHSTSS